MRSVRPGPPHEWAAELLTAELAASLAVAQVVQEARRQQPAWPDAALSAARAVQAQGCQAALAKPEHSPVPMASVWVSPVEADVPE
jgi:hypothetical protein